MANKNSKLYEETEKATHAYVGQCKECGAYCAAFVDTPSLAKDIAKEIAAWIRDGLSVTRVEMNFVRENFNSCTCKPVKKEKETKSQPEGQMQLF